MKRYGYDVPTVTRFEPHQALFADNHGYAIYESIIEDLPHVMEKAAQLFLKLVTIKVRHLNQ